MEPKADGQTMTLKYKRVENCVRFRKVTCMPVQKSTCQGPKCCHCVQDVKASILPLYKYSLDDHVCDCRRN